MWQEAPLNYDSCSSVQQGIPFSKSVVRRATIANLPPKSEEDQGPPGADNTVSLGRSLRLTRAGGWSTWHWTAILLSSTHQYRSGGDGDLWSNLQEAWWHLPGAHRLDCEKPEPERELPTWPKGQATACYRSNVVTELHQPLLRWSIWGWSLMWKNQPSGVLGWWRYRNQMV